MENYTLNRFHSEAVALLEKYGFSDTNFKTNVSFNLEEINGLKILTCTITHEKKGSRYNDGSVRFFAHGSTPNQALKDLDDDLRKETKKFIAETVSVDLSEI